MQWCRAHLLWHLCWEKSFSLEGLFPAIKSIFLKACASGVLGLAARQRPNKVGVMIGMNSHASETGVAHWLTSMCPWLWRLVIGGWKLWRLWEEDVDARHVCGQVMAKAERGWGWRVGGEGHRGEQRPPGSGPQRRAWQSQSGQQWKASLLTSPLLHFHWRLSNKYMLTSKTFKRSSDFFFPTS